ncbi:hypothetical protein PGB28_06960 [Primorskyibacter aestuariivivens]|uniref:hypothetical protein n=1 Tax=Primorskyibacter aestuariivivens TaxID=1888912 RepID=UPI002301D443|nr:hypothetical protein [Primorskyibacter aestuariivivens]MDA7428192.1 hypothetical protein [Primorskyibacter aestuariivivens]
MNEKLLLKAIREYHKFRRNIRSWNRALAHMASPISDDYSRAPLSLDSVAKSAIGQGIHDHQDKNVPAYYSTFCGPTSRLTFRPQKQMGAYPKYFVSNNPKVLQIVNAYGWRPIFLDLPISSNPIESAHQAKIAKAVPHLFPDLRQHRYLIYVDDKQGVKPDRIETDLARLKSERSPMAAALWSHISGNILLEYTTGMLNERYRLQSHHMARYTMQKLAKGAQLDHARCFATGYILRDTEHPLHDSLSRKWYDDIMECGVLCQLSFNFLAQEHAEIIDLPPLKAKKSFLEHGPQS